MWRSYTANRAFKTPNQSEDTACREALNRGSVAVAIGSDEFADRCFLRNTELTAGAYAAVMDRQKEFVLRTLEERDIRFVRLWFTDVLGFLKSVAIAPAELEGAFEEGIGFDGSSIEGFARVSESDTVARPDPSTFQVLPWTTSAGKHHSARMFCDITMPDGSPSWADSRHVLRRQLAKASDLGFSCYVHPEIEFFLLQPGTGRRLGADPRRQRRLLRPGRARLGAELPPACHRRAGVDGHLGGVQPPRGRAGPAGDRPALRRRAVDGRQRDDVPVCGQGGRARRRRPGVVHAEAVRRIPRLGDAHPHEPVRGRDERVPQRRRPAAAVRHRKVVHRGHFGARHRDQRGHQPVGELLQAAGARRRGARRPRRGDSRTGRRWSGCRCTRRARRRRVASRCAAPIRRATRT